MDAPASARFLKHGLHRSVRVELGAGSGSGRIVKRLASRGRLRALLDGRRARREWRALRALRGAGLPVPAPLELRRVAGGWELATELIAGAVTLRALLAGEAAWPVPAGRVARALGELFARGWALGLVLSDAHAGNVLVAPGGEPWLVDVGRARLRGVARARPSAGAGLERALAVLAADVREEAAFGFRARFLVAFASAAGIGRAARAEIGSRVEARARARRRAVIARAQRRWTRGSSAVRRFAAADGLAGLARRGVEEERALALARAALAGQERAADVAAAAVTAARATAADERTPDERTPDERTMDERTPDERTPDERTMAERTMDERTAGERTAGEHRERRADEPTADEHAAAGGTANPRVAQVAPANRRARTQPERSDPRALELAAAPGRRLLLRAASEATLRRLWTNAARLEMHGIPAARPLVLVEAPRAVALFELPDGARALETIAALPARERRRASRNLGACLGSLCDRGLELAEPRRAQVWIATQGARVFLDPAAFANTPRRWTRPLGRRSRLPNLAAAGDPRLEGIDAAAFLAGWLVALRGGPAERRLLRARLAGDG